MTNWGPTGRFLFVRQARRSSDCAVGGHEACPGARGRPERLFNAWISRLTFFRGSLRSAEASLAGVGDKLIDTASSCSSSSSTGNISSAVITLVLGIVIVVVLLVKWVLLALAVIVAFVWAWRSSSNRRRQWPPSESIWESGHEHTRT